MVLDSMVLERMALDSMGEDTVLGMDRNMGCRSSSLLIQTK